MLRILREWLDRSRALRDERKLRAHNNTYARRHVGDRLQTANRALDAGDRATSLQIWKAVRTEYPDITLESREGLFLLMSLQRFDEAEAMMQEGCRRFPRNAFYVEGAALVATKRGDNEEAARRYSILRKKFPSLICGYVDGTVPLIRLGRLDEADKILGRVANPFDDIGRAMEHARLAMRRKDWPVALNRWEQLWKRREHPSVQLGIAQCYKEMGRLYEAEQILTVALSQPMAAPIPFWVEMALVAERRVDWAEAVRRWDNVRMRSPSTIDAYCHGALALNQCGLHDDADSLLHAATERFASSPEIWIAYAKAAERGGRPDEAEERWEEVRTRFPNARITDAVR